MSVANFINASFEVRDGINYLIDCQHSNCPFFSCLDRVSPEAGICSNAHTHSVEILLFVWGAGYDHLHCHQSCIYCIQLYLPHDSRLAIRRVFSSGHWNLVCSCVCEKQGRWADSIRQGSPCHSSFRSDSGTSTRRVVSFGKNCEIFYATLTCRIKSK